MQGMPSDTLTDKLYNVPFRMTHCGNIWTDVILKCCKLYDPFPVRLSERDRHMRDAL